MLPLILGGLSVAGQLFSGMSARKQAKRANALEARRTAIANAVREANNRVKVAGANVQRFQASENNKRRGAAGDSQRSAVVRNIIRMEQDNTSKSLTQQIEQAGKMGELVARAGAVGLGGSSVDRLHSVMELQDAIGVEAQGRQKMAMTFEGQEQLSNLQMQSILGIDMGYVDPSLDHNTIEANTVAVPSMGSILLGAAATGLSTYMQYRNAPIK